MNNNASISSKHSKQSKLSKKENKTASQTVSDFYASAKEKLIKLKEDAINSEEMLKLEKQKLGELTMIYDEHTEISKNLDVMIKGLEERLVLAKKTKNDLTFQIRDLNKNIQDKETEIDRINSSTNFQVNKADSQAAVIQNLHKKQLDAIQEAIEKERQMGKEMSENLQAMEIRISEMKEQVQQISSIEGEANKQVAKETSDMAKFLSEL